MQPSATQQIIDYLRHMADTPAGARLSPADGADLVAYIDQLRGINVTFAEALAENESTLRGL